MRHESKFSFGGVGGGRGGKGIRPPLSEFSGSAPANPYNSMLYCVPCVVHKESLGCPRFCLAKQVLIMRKSLPGICSRPVMISLSIGFIVFFSLLTLI